MQTLVLVPILLILTLCFFPLSHQQAGLVTGGGLVIPPDRPLQQQRQQVRRNPNLKLIYNNRCGNTGWFTVRRNQCPIAFIDPTFIYHQAICNNVGSWAQLFPRRQVGRMFVFNTGRANRGNRIRYCANVPIAYCPALNRCPNNPVFPINPVNPGRPRCSCSSDCRIDNTDPRGRRFCYVTDRTIINPACNIFPSRSIRGAFYSYAACRNNFLRGGREDEDGFERSGEVTEDDASDEEDVGIEGAEFIQEIYEDAINEDTDVDSNVVNGAP